jgi:hypothetical protein
VLLLLHCEYRVRMGRTHILADALTSMADHHHELVRVELINGRQNMAHK